MGISLDQRCNNMSLTRPSFLSSQAVLASTWYGARFFFSLYFICSYVCTPLTALLFQGWWFYSRWAFYVHPGPGRLSCWQEALRWSCEGYRWRECVQGIRQAPCWEDELAPVRSLDEDGYPHGERGEEVMGYLWQLGAIPCLIPEYTFRPTVQISSSFMCKLSNNVVQIIKLLSQEYFAKRCTYHLR